MDEKMRISFQNQGNWQDELWVRSLIAAKRVFKQSDF